MADLSDVVNALNAVVTTAVYPSGLPPALPVAGDTAQVFNGWPLPADLQALIDDYHRQVRIARTIVSIYPRTGMFKNTSRWPSIWQEIGRSSASITASIDSTGTIVTFGGNPPVDNTQNIAIVGLINGIQQVFSYQTVPSDTVNSIAAALTKRINAGSEFPQAWNFGPVIQFASASELVVRIGVFGVVGREQRRQEERIDINVWTASPELRDQVGVPVREAFAQYDFLTLPDGFGARIRCAGDHWLDDPEKIGLYRRMLSFDVDYATTQLAGAAEIIVFQAVGPGSPTPLSY